MSTANVRPRVNKALLSAYTDKHVTLMGTIDAINGTDISLILSDGIISGTVISTLLNEIQKGDCYELIGKVISEDKVKILHANKIPRVLPKELESRLLQMRESEAKVIFNPPERE